MPTLAMEAHAAAIDDTVDAALADAGIGLADLDAVAVTIGPGLSLCLRVSSSPALESVRDGINLVGRGNSTVYSCPKRILEAASNSAGVARTNGIDGTVDLHGRHRRADRWGCSRRELWRQRTGCHSCRCTTWRRTLWWPG